VSSFAMDSKFAKKRGRVETREGCELLCISETEFPCRSATYNARTGDCRISDMDRHTVAGTGAFVESVDDTFLENNCVDDPVKLCDFQLLENRIMKTVDSVYQDVPTMEACRDLCLNAPYRCHSFDYGDTGQRVCRLSHHTSTTLTQIQEPFLVIDDVVGTYELSACYNVTIDCRASEMIATVRTNKIFNGKIYAKDNPNSCVVDVESGIEFKIAMGYNDIECNVKRQARGSVYSNEVIIQHHDSIVTSSDLGLALNCQYDLTNRTILNDFDLAIDGEIEPSLFQEAVVESPNVVMKITGRGGAEIQSAQVGDPLELRFEILDLSSPYEIFVRDLIAKDGNDQSEIVLLDSQGCPAEGQIMGPLQQDPANPKVLVTNFDAFKFPTSEVVQFRAHITPCMPTCEPASCSYRDYYGGGNSRVSSYGKRRRREAAMTDEVALSSSLRESRSYAAAAANSAVEGQKVLITQAFVVTDKFKNKRGGESRPEEVARPPQRPSSPEAVHHPRNTGFQQPPRQERRPLVDNVLMSPRPSQEFDYDLHQESDVRSRGSPEAAETTPEAEVCLNTTGIVVSVSLFVVVQLILAFACMQFWRRRGAKEEQDLAIRSMFNPYTVRK